LEVVSLPARVIRVLDGELGEWGGVAAREGRIESRQFTDEEAERPAVADDVMEGEEQEVLAWAVAQQRGAKQRAVLKVEEEVSFLEGEAAGFGEALTLP
jgi:hypothetical protein